MFAKCLIVCLGIVSILLNYFKLYSTKLYLLFIHTYLDLGKFGDTWLH